MGLIKKIIVFILLFFVFQSCTDKKDLEKDPFLEASIFVLENIKLEEDLYSSCLTFQDSLVVEASVISEFYKMRFPDIEFNETDFLKTFNNSENIVIKEKLDEYRKKTNLIVKIVKMLCAVLVLIFAYLIVVGYYNKKIGVVLIGLLVVVYFTFTIAISTLFDYNLKTLKEDIKNKTFMQYFISDP